tara:strand:+ start:637 stop:1152 length:516 start_codon:yes stop_codon:yes gene_type:complete
MNHEEHNRELKHEELLLRSLLTGSPTTARAQEILNLTFTPFVKWTMEDVHDQLKHVYNFTTQEAETIIENYPIAIPTQTEVLSRNPPLPTFTPNDEKVIAYSQDLWNSRALLTEAKKLLSKNKLTREHYQDDEEFNKAISEAANVEAAFLQICKFIDKERENAHLHMQEPC